MRRRQRRHIDTRIARSHTRITRAHTRITRPHTRIARPHARITRRTRLRPRLDARRREQREEHPERAHYETFVNEKPSGPTSTFTVSSAL